MDERERGTEERCGYMREGVHERERGTEERGGG